VFTSCIISSKLSTYNVAGKHTDTRYYNVPLQNLPHNIIVVYSVPGLGKQSSFYGNEVQCLIKITALYGLLDLSPMARWISVPCHSYTLSGSHNRNSCVASTFLLCLYVNQSLTDDTYTVRMEGLTLQHMCVLLPHRG